MDLMEKYRKKFDDIQKGGTGIACIERPDEHEPEVPEEQRHDFEDHAAIMGSDGYLSEEQVKKGDEDQTDLPITGLGTWDNGALNRAAYRIFSDILQAHLWVVPGKEDMETFRKQGITEPIYTRQEIRKLKGVGAKELKAVHIAKEVFENSEVEEVMLGSANRGSS